MEREKAMLHRAFSAAYGSILKSQMNIKNLQRISKPEEASDAFRKAGNALYNQKSHDNNIHLNIFQNYCRAILTAPNDSEYLALGYGNRSAFLLHIKKYEDCIKDVDRAVNISKSNILKVKLLCRKAECLKQLRSSDEEIVLKEADGFINKIDCTETRNIYNELVKNIKAMKINDDTSPEKERTVLETKDPTEFIKIGYNKEFGRHLIAAKDYAPGDIIFVEKAYATLINPRMIYTNCDYCLKTAWSGIPCRSCSWAIFCSEDCRDKANELYHDIECSLIPFLKATMMDELLNIIKLNIRLIIIAVREAGCISELRSRLKAVDKCKDMSLKGFYKNGKFKSNTIESLYSLCSHYPEPDTAFVGQATAVLMVLIGLSTHTKLLNNFSFKKIDDLMKSNELMFLGSLMMKLIMIRRNTNDAVCGIYETCEQGSSLSQCLATSCCTRGFFMSSLTSLINHSCFPNSGRCFTDNKTIIIHAIHPIKKGDQISMEYFSNFYNNPLPERQENLKVRNILQCFCQPCKENWPPILCMPKKVLEKHNLDIKTELEKKLYHDCSTIFTALGKKSVVKNKFAYFKMEDLEKLSMAMTEAFHNLKQPSYLICKLFKSLREVFLYIYGLKPRHFGICDKFDQHSD